ncbi:hypothetical protein CJ030_MR8G024938 [Morella rubra]|uniref:Uncharacterized protein n=1 Tax=Morella rubra TaxID=262757 RepID=A0A6A1UQY2_9ROSI|nr:hypothetical protein CJ030_MR8G024938 [Morella rubra]
MASYCILGFCRVPPRVPYGFLFDMLESKSSTVEVGFLDLLRCSSRKARGATHMAEVWNLEEGEVIPTQFNDMGQPVGVEGGVFGQFTGSVPRVSNLIPLDVKDWRRVPMAAKEDCWNIMTERHFDEARTPQEVKSRAPSNVNLDQFYNLVDFWFSSTGRDRSQRGKQSRSLQTYLHTGGSRSFAHHAYEMEKEKQVAIDRAVLYKAVHSHFDGTPMNVDAAEKIRQIEEILCNESATSQPLSNLKRKAQSIGHLLTHMH